MPSFLWVGFCYVHLIIFNSCGRNSIQETKSPPKISKRNEAPGKLWSFIILLYWCISQLVNNGNLHKINDAVSNVHDHMWYGRNILSYQLYIDLYWMLDTKNFCKFFFFFSHFVISAQNNASFNIQDEINFLGWRFYSYLVKVTSRNIGFIFFKQSFFWI